MLMHIATIFSNGQYISALTFLIGYINFIDFYLIL